MERVRTDLKGKSDGGLEYREREKRMSGLWTVFEENANVINAIIGMLGLAVSMMGVYYGRKAYIAAHKIFEEGLKLDEAKLFEQVGLEFTINFIIPFSEFKIVTKNIWEGDRSEQKLSAVSESLSRNMFDISFPYFDLHKGDVYYSLRSHDEMDPNGAFNKIQKFVYYANQFARKRDAICRMLGEDKVKTKYDTLEALYNSNPSDYESTLGSIRELQKNLDEG